MTNPIQSLSLVNALKLKRERSEDLLPKGLEKKLNAKIDHLVPELQATFPDIISIWKHHNAPTPVITSGNDSKHEANSKHYSNTAIDLRGNNVSDTTLKSLARELQERLGEKYFVLAEIYPHHPANDHIHIQFNGP